MMAWWNGLQARERRMLQVGGVLLALLLGWAFVWYPLARDRVELTRQVTEQRQALIGMRSDAAEAVRLRGLGARGQTSRQGKSLLALADASAREAGLETDLKRVEPLSERSVRVSLEGASFDGVTAWLETVAHDYSVQATDFSADRADGVGVVNVRVTLEDR